MKRLSDYQVAGIVLTVFAEYRENYIAPAGYYDDSADMNDEMLKRVNAAGAAMTVRQFSARLFRICRKLAQIGVLYGRTICTQKEYVGEPIMERQYLWVKPWYALRLRPDGSHYAPQGTPEEELKFMLRHFPGRQSRRKAAT